MMRPLLAMCLLLTASATLPPAAAQVAPPPRDAGIVSVDVAPEPVVDAASVATAWVRNNGPVDTVVTAVFRYGDHTPLTGSETPGGVGHTLSRSVPAGETLPFRLAFVPPAPRAGDQRVLVTISSSGDGNATNDTATLPVFVRNPDLRVAFETPSRLDVLPSGTTFLRFFVENRGNAEDAPVLNVTVDAPWEARPYAPLRPIPPRSSGIGILLVTAGEEDGAPENLSLNLTVHSRIRMAVSDTAKAPPLRINGSEILRPRAVEILGLPPEKQVFPGEEVAETLILRNAGDADDVFLVDTTLPGGGAGWTAGVGPAPSWPDNLSHPPDDGPLAIPLRAGETLPLRWNATRGAHAAPPPMEILVNATSLNAPLLATQVPPRFHATAATRLVEAGPDLALAEIHLPPVTYQGDVLEIAFNVTNLGRVDAAPALLEATLGDNLRVAARADLVVPPLPAGNEIRLAWRVPADGLQGDYAVAARLVANGSDDDRRAANDEARAPLHVRLPQLALLAPADLRAVPGATLVLAGATGGLAVANRGDRPETLLAELASTHPWLQAAWRLEDVPPGGVHPLPLELPIPPYPHVRGADATLRVWVENRTAYRAETNLTLRLEDRAPPELAPVAPAASTPAGSPARLAVRARDATGILRAEAVVTPPDGPRVHLHLQPNATHGDVYETTFTPTTAGRHTLEFRFEDASEHALTAVLEGIPWNVTETAYEGLVPANFHDGAALSHPTLRFREAQGGTTRSATLDVGAGPAPLPFPYEAALPPREGPHVVRLEAVAVHGATITRTWNVTLDATPPHLTGGLARDAPQGNVELRVQAPDAVRAVARFETPGGPVEIPLEKRGNTFHGVAPRPPAWRAVAFVAWDQAGNPGSLQVDAPRDTPLWGWAPLAALALAGVLSRRPRGGTKAATTKKNPPGTGYGHGPLCRERGRPGGPAKGRPPEGQNPHEAVRLQTPPARSGPGGR